MNLFKKMLVGLCAIILYKITIDGTVYEDFANTFCVSLAAMGLVELTIYDRFFAKHFGKNVREFKESLEK